MTDHETRLDIAIPPWEPALPRCIAATTIGILVGVSLVHCISPLFAQELFEPLGLEPTAEQIAKYKLSVVRFWTQNYTLDIAVIGMVLGVSCGLLTTSRRGIVSALLGGGIGLSLGACTGWVASRWGVHEFILSSDQSLLRSIAMHATVWSIVPSGIWVAIGFVQNKRPLVTIGVAGFVSGVLASAAYLLIFAIVFPSADLSQLICRTIPKKLIWGILIATILGLGMFLSLKPAVRSNVPVTKLGSDL
jgi:hypothetical protein